MATSSVKMRQTVFPVLFYRDASNAITWLTGAFGFEPVMTVPGPDGQILHAELAFNGSILMLGTRPEGEGSGGTASTFISVEDVDAHYQRAVAAGATIEREPFDTDYGSRDYTARDPEGNTWYFGTYQG